VVIDVGTTALEVARALPITFRGTVATCSLLVAAELAGRPTVEVLVSGGRVRAGDLACSNAQALSFFADLRPDVAFLGSGGVDTGTGLTDFHLDEVATRRIILANTARSYVLADSTKFGRVAPHRVCGLEEFDGLITDEMTSAPLRAAIERAGGVVVTP
jgi:DeoR/GlpR family transcriptional regulator of sugar metabolism